MNAAKHMPGCGLTILERARIFVTAVDNSGGLMIHFRNGEFFAFVVPRWLTADCKHYEVTAYGPSHKRGGYGPTVRSYSAKYGLQSIGRRARAAIVDANGGAA